MKRPNILLFMPDQWRGDWIGPHNPGGARTPNVDRLMTRGVNFSRAICPSPICGPSRAALASGFEYDRAGVPTNAFSIAPGAPNFYRQLRNAGYQVLTCGKVDLLKGELDWGRDGQHMREGRSRLAELGFTGGLDSGGKHAVLFAHEAGKDEPFLCFLRDRGLAEAYVADFRTRNNPALGRNAVSHPGAGPNYANTAPSGLPDDAYQDNWIGQCGLDLLHTAARAERPWFLQVNLAGPHEPMNITAAMADSVADADPPPPTAPGAFPPETHRAIRRNYIAMLENCDRILGQYIDLFERTGQIENTVVIVTSDHGEMLGDCGLWEKFVPHQPSLHVPLVCAGPGIATGRATDQPASFLDLHATIVALAGAEPIAGIDSRSLVPTLGNPEVWTRDVALSGLGQWRIAIDGTYKMVAGYDPGAARKVLEGGRFDAATSGPWRLVEPAADPCEEQDLSASHPDIATRLRAAIEASARRARP
jgi:arylsulfatase A-like enzyme